jgi:hypothetical protein
MHRWKGCPVIEDRWDIDHDGKAKATPNRHGDPRPRRAPDLDRYDRAVIHRL